jgi:hypothetical protein
MERAGGMRISTVAYVGRDNETDWIVQIDGVTIGENILTRAQLTAGPHCIDTEEAGDPIELTASATTVSMRLGQIPDLSPGRVWTAILTVYTPAHPAGVAVEAGTITTRAWPVCD